MSSADSKPTPVNIPVSIIEQQLPQERPARQAAEGLLLTTQRLDLYASNAQLQQLNAKLEQCVNARTAALATTLAQTQQANDAKTEFALTLRQVAAPIRSLITALQALQATPLDAQQLNHVQSAQATADLLSKFINTGLDAPQVAADLPYIAPTPFDLSVLIEQTVQLLRPLADRKQLQLIHDIDAGIPKLLQGDATRLGQVLTHLLTNALQFTQAGCVSLFVDTLGLDMVGGDVVSPADTSSTSHATPVMIRFAVQDTGMGMSEAAQHELLQQFAATKTATSSAIVDGSRLDLVMCKQLVTLMNGELNLDSTLGKGSCFTLFIPLLACTPAVNCPAPPTLTNTVAKQHILVVDDNDTNRQVAVTILAQLGYQVSTAVDGLDALTTVQRSPEFDLIMMDCHMPVVDGIDATKAIRTWEQANGRTGLPIIAVSASAYQEDRQRCAAAGMNDFIAKPITLVVVRNALQKWLPRSGTATKLSNRTASTTQFHALPTELFNLVQFSEMHELAGNKFVELLQRFHEDAERQLENMHTAAVLQDAEVLRRSAHKLKGSSGSIGAYALSASCECVEANARAGRLEHILAEVQAVRSNYELSRQALASYL